MPENNETVKWHQKMAEQGDAASQIALGVMYANGHGVDQDFTKAAEWYGRAVEQGHKTAQYKLGLLHMHGQGVPRDLRKAEEYFLMSAAQGYAPSQTMLGNLYTVTGHGHAHVSGFINPYIPKNDEKAAEWYQLAAEWHCKSAEQGNADALCALGHMYNMGWGVYQDEEEALRLFLESAEQGNAIAQYMVGDSYFYGIRGLRQDYGEAEKWLLKSTEQGCESARRALSLLYDIMDDFQYNVTD